MWFTSTENLRVAAYPSILSSLILSFWVHSEQHLAKSIMSPPHNPCAQTLNIWEN